MNIINKLIKWFGGYTREEMENNSGPININATYELDPHWKYSKQEKLENNCVPLTISSTVTKQGVSRVAYNGPLGDEVPAYSLRTNKNTSNTSPCKHKNVDKDKKKVRPVKQSGKHK